MYTGKSSFLQYALAMALSKKIPVLYCDSPEEGYLSGCDAHGCRLIPCSLRGIQLVPQSTLVLIDFTPSMKHVPHVFATTQFKGYVVQAVPPDRGC